MRPKHPNMEAFQAEMDALPLRTLCMACDWEYMGTALEARQEALKHRTALHPERKNSRRPGRNLRTFHQPRLSDEHTAEIMADRAKRARLIGIDL